jgi:hypothetical protein
VLGDVQYYETELAKSMKEQVERAVKEGRLKPSEGVKLLDDYEAGMKAYTYLDGDASIGVTEPAPAAPPPVSAPAPARNGNGHPKEAKEKEKEAKTLFSMLPDPQPAL